MKNFGRRGDPFLSEFSFDSLGNWEDLLGQNMETLCEFRGFFLDR